ncbi:phage gp6-like head-tail connector protein [Pseudoxanthomonas winnipegensis]|uniref:Phage gp6-like head-tail connector protein n=1 Tax=Pseudoxanthomonas winnipegensis TaxID=2480810 RepID=A0ABY1WCP3_9GAMM|nr:head-tail connector protein [Pseudoxanthomonas winnipegensis]TAA12474.1 phage gp6-like head-tail connector protein [Pseudoxanthomonas winnipegensis]TAA19161.1 phage gp6-like head-tail connector protein [Pseudoxanthomonas winnipegensis]TAH70422.1 phage gp6-like head-tail connector protein [Pseudoxanthomonas winnipegensis]
MPLVTLEEARAHCRADSEDVLQPYLDAALEAAQTFLNRRVFGEPEALAAAIAAVPADLAQAQVDHDAAVVAAGALDGVARAQALAAAERALRYAVHRADATYEGVVTTAAINAAVLLTTGHLFRNREAVITGQQAAATELPQGAQALLWPYRVGLGI